MKVSTRNIGKTDTKVSVLGIGGAPFGGNFSQGNHADAVGVVQTGFDAGLNFVDTAPFYGFGRSERAVGDAIRGRDYILSSKVGRLMAPGASDDPNLGGMVDPLPFTPVYDYTYDAIMRSYEDSLQRLGLDRVDILLVHDIGVFQHGEEDNKRYFAQLADSGYRALDELRSGGQVQAIGLGVNENAVCIDALKMGDWDTFLLAGRYTLLEQTPLDDLIPDCLASGTTLIIGGPFNAGVMLGGELWNYTKAPQHIIDQVKNIHAICADHNVDPAVAAMQFPLAHPVVSSIIPGAKTVQEFQGILNWASQSTPAGLWSDLQSAGLIHTNAPLPDGKPLMG